MANNKTGFIYYSTDTNRYQDIKIKKLKRGFGGFGVAIYDYILCEIYRVKGCFIEWDESTAFDVADYWDVKESLVGEIVNYCCNVGLFNKELLASEGILSSKPIVSRYVDWSKKAKRSFKLPEKLANLLEESPKLPEQSAKPMEVCPQSKVKESKGENKKDLIDVEFPISECLEIALRDEKWVRLNNTNKAELLEFNGILDKRGEYERNPKDYKSHFANWKGMGKITVATIKKMVM